VRFSRWFQRRQAGSQGAGPGQFSFPYGIALAAAALAVYPETGWMPTHGL